MSLSFSSAPYSVVVLPEPVGPVTSRMPCGRAIMSSSRARIASSMPSCARSSLPACLSRRRSTTRSPRPAGIVDTRTSTGRPAMRSPMRPSCGRRFSAMSSFAMTLMRDTTAFAIAFCGAQHFAQHAVDAEAHDETVLVRLDVDVRRAFLDRFGQERVDQADDRRVVLAFEQVFGFGQFVGERLADRGARRDRTPSRAHRRPARRDRAADARTRSPALS